MEVNPAPQTKFAFPKEYILLFLGALITLGTTLVINAVNNKHDEKKQTRQERIQFADSLMKNVAKRFAYIAELYNAKSDSTEDGTKKWITLNEDLDVYEATYSFYNYSRLKILFSDSLANTFRKSIDDPLYNFEQNIIYTSYTKINKKIVMQDHASLDTVMHNFAGELYQQAFTYQ